ncbi:MAG: HNH endonuclease, partial [Gammaproteobacteria bacterium]|nr:HNH endonuclease [Gammaproteobacteria bacterium]
RVCCERPTPTADYQPSFHSPWLAANAFIKWYKKPTQSIAKQDGESKQAIVIAEISSKTFTKDLTSFIKNVETFKVIAASGEINEATLLSDKELEEKALNSQSKRKPKKSKGTTTIYERNKYIAELAKRKAKGKCQLCIKKAPFKNKSGQPYLETHHIKWLSKGGKDTIDNTVALCPNCHKKMHVINASSDVNKLLRAAKSPNN